MAKTLKAPLIVPKFRFVDVHEIKVYLGLSDKDLADIRKTLASPIYWQQRVPGGKIYYNLTLWQHWFLSVMNGSECDRKDHARLVEEYTNSIPKPN